MAFGTQAAVVSMTATSKPAPLNAGVSFPARRVRVENYESQDGFTLLVNSGAPNGQARRIKPGEAGVFVVDDVSKLWVASEGTDLTVKWAVETDDTMNFGLLNYGGISSRYLADKIHPRRSTLVGPAPTYIHTFEQRSNTITTDAWWNAGSGGTSVLASEHVLRGKQSPPVSLKVTGSLNSSNPIFMEYDLNNPANFSGDKCSWRLSYYVEQQGPMTALGMRFFTDSGKTTGWNMQMLPVAPGWHHVEFCPSILDIAKFATPDWANPVVKLQIVSTGATGSSGPVPIVHFDYFEVVPTNATKGAVVLRFDDALDSQMENAIPYALALGFPVCIMIHPRYMGANTDYTTLARFQEFVDTDMVEVGIHYGTNGPWSTFPSNARPASKGISPPTDDEKHAYVIASKQAAIDAGYIDAAERFAVGVGTKGNDTFGYKTRADFAIMKQHCAVVAGSSLFWSGTDGTTNAQVGSPSNCFTPRFRRNPWFYPAVDLVGLTNSDGGAGDTPFINFKAFVDAAAAHRDTAYIACHNVGPATLNVWSMLTADFQRRMDYLKTKVDAGLIDVVTYSQLAY